MAGPDDVKRFLPIMAWLPGYERRWLRADVIAGITITAVLVPEGMAYAQIAGVPPQVAFYMAPIGLLLYAIFGTSRHLVVAVSSGVAVMSASIVGDLAEPNSTEFIALTAGLALLTGLISVFAGLVRLGGLARFFSHSVLVGYVSGLAIFIIVKQLPKISGVEGGEGNTIERVIELFRQLPDANRATVIVGLATMALMVIIEKRFHRVPAALAALVFGILVVTVFGLGARGVEVVGDIPAGLASPQIPDLSLADVVALLSGAVALTLFVFAEAIGPAKDLASNHGYRIDENQELIGLGAANIGAGLFQGFPNGASLSKSAAADAAGGRTQISGLVAAGATVLVALFLTPLFENLPEAALGAIVIVAVSGMFHYATLQMLYRVRRADFALAVIALIGVLVFEEVLAGLLVAVVASLVALVARASSPRLSELVRLPGTLEFRNSIDSPEGLTTAGLLILRPDEGIFFANADAVRSKVRDTLDASQRDIDVVMLDLALSNDTDVPGTEMIEELCSELKTIGVDLMLATVRAPVLAVLESSGVIDAIGRENIAADVPTGTISYVRSHAEPLPTEDIDAIVARIDGLTDVLRGGWSSLSDEQREDLTASIERLASSFRS
jgi:high affinity sulfate transporter 1